MLAAAVGKIESSDGSISKSASKDDIMGYLRATAFVKEDNERATTIDTTTDTTAPVVKTYT